MFITIELQERLMNSILVLLLSLVSLNALAEDGSMINQPYQ